jgi:amidase
MINDAHSVQPLEDVSKDVEENDGLPTYRESGGDRMKDQFADLDAIAQAELVRQRRVSPLDLVDAAIARIQALNSKLNAVIIPLFEQARAQAKSGAIPDGPFRGVPFLMKDLGAAYGGDPLYMGMKLLRDARFIAPHDSYLAAKFKAAGFVCVGKTNTPELGLITTTEPEAFGPSRNPWDVTRSTGGSSGGSAAAVASRMVAVAHANDGGGSIRIPASECGLVGLKPSRGRISLGPDTGDAWHGFVTEHVVTRSVRDTAAVLDQTAGYMPGDPYAAPVQRGPFFRDAIAPPEQRLRIGLMRRTPRGANELHPDCLAAVDDAASVLQSLGHSVEESHPAALDESLSIMEPFVAVISGHTAMVLDQLGTLVGRKITAEDVEPWTWFLAEQGFGLSASNYLGAIQVLQILSRQFMQWWADGFDLLLIPTLASPPPLLGELVITRDGLAEGMRRLLDLSPYCAFFNITGQPAISLPLFWNSSNLPIGVQLVADFGREDLLIRVAAQLEQARPWKDRRPPVCG